MQNHKSLLVAVIINSQLSVNNYCLLLLHTDMQKRDFLHIPYAIRIPKTLFPFPFPFPFVTQQLLTFPWEIAFPYTPQCGAPV